jgi:hypothetical protein
VYAIGLEFDIDNKRAANPSVFVALRSAAVRDPRVIEDMASRLRWHSPDPQLMTALQSCIVALPDGAAIKFMGSMLGRPSRPLRVNVRGIRADQIGAYLRAACWPYSTEALAVVTSLSSCVDELVLCLDLSDQLLPRVGFELILYEQPLHEPRWAALLDRLEQLELTRPATRQALLRWPGYSDETSSSGRWPPNLAWGDSLLGRDAISMFYRYVSHLKLVWRPNRGLTLKAYLGFCHQWLDRTAPNPIAPTPGAFGSQAFAHGV